MSNLVNEAVEFMEEFQRLYEAETDPAEKIILLRVLTERLNTWTIAMRIDLIKKKSKESP